VFGSDSCGTAADIRQEAIDYMPKLADLNLWFIEEPTSPDDILGHARIRKALKPHGIGVATGEHVNNRVMFKQLLQAEAIDAVQLDALRLSGINEILSVCLLAAKFGVPVVPHSGGTGMPELCNHISHFDFVAISGKQSILGESSRRLLHRRPG
jgi:L-alanine-DL-glutamate epimerase-like enolase superfamily enzyme